MKSHSDTRLSGNGPQNCMMLKRRDSFLKESYQRYRDELYRYLRRMVNGRSQEAKDITQMAFTRLAALTDPQTLRNPRAFLYTTARNIVIDRARRRQVKAKHMEEVPLESWHEPGHGISPEHIALDRERLAVLKTVIENLPAKPRRIFVLNRVYGLSYREIAEEMGLKEENVKKHVFRALKKCTTEMAKIYKNSAPSTPTDEMPKSSK